MSTFYNVEYTCAVCGETHEFRVIGSTNTFGGAPDLDLRPPEMQRSTMSHWIQECPSCGYISSSVDEDTTINADFLKTPEYLSCDGINFESALAARFYKYYKISLHDSKPRDAFFAILHAAWACDDYQDDVNAAHCRKLSLPLLSELIDSATDEKETLSLIQADIMRRAGLFDEVKRRFADTRYSQDLLNQILEFELSRADQHDVDCYTVSDVTGE